jgi:hypothetical protein
MEPDWTLVVDGDRGSENKGFFVRNTLNNIRLPNLAGSVGLPISVREATATRLPGLEGKIGFMHYYADLVLTALTACERKVR